MSFAASAQAWHCSSLRACLPFSAQPFLEQGSVCRFRAANDDCQERNPNCDTLNAGSLCRSRLLLGRLHHEGGNVFFALATVAAVCSRSSSASGIQESTCRLRIQKSPKGPKCSLRAGWSQLCGVRVWAYSKLSLTYPNSVN